MVHKHAFKALDRSMNDIFNTRRSGDSQMLFGGKVIVFGGDFRQILPVIPNAGEGKVGGDNNGDAVIEIPHDLLITDFVDPISALIEFVYPSILENINNSAYFQERAILAPKNEVVQEINDCLMSLFPGEEKENLSSDMLCELEHLHDEFDKTLYSPDVLNCLKLSGIPNHKILLKVGVPIILLRNIDQKSGLCNGN
ncbi:uncharacterized protein LOC112509055 [Cynara cardunculus var. scolymus]|uniref:uncharacterized protein LOC112509055 n=1 Tax=Cynara cardunculus var. scolymus TaxID=59895 RepID=UPI000D624D2B|nr:uncharacterized protein LOC112509055 [Cynara cardunculus var. scolymus]